MIANYFKQISLLSFALLTALLTTVTVVQADDADPSPDILIFTGEIRNFMQQAKEMRTAKDDKQDALVNDLKATGSRIARVYFAAASTNLKPEFDKFLAETLKTNKDLNAYFVFVGNAFLERAQQLMDERTASQHTIKVRSRVGGAIVGLAVAGGYIFLRTKFIAPGTPLNVKDAIYATIAFLGVGGASWVGGNMVAYKLPVNMELKNAQDFKAKYPHGEDYVRELEDSAMTADLQMSVSAVCDASAP